MEIGKELEAELAALRKGEPGRCVSPPCKCDESNRSVCAYWHKAAPVIPDGMVLVPKEPTERMCRAGEECEGGSTSTPWLDGEYTPENVELIYKAMISAAQGEKDAPKD